MFTANFLEKISTKVHLPGKNYKEILTMLKVIYPNFIVNLEEIELSSLLQISEEYDMKKVKR